MSEALGAAKISERNAHRLAGSRSYQVTSPAPREVWRRLLEHDPEALPSQSPDWLDCICTYQGYRDASRLYTLADGQQLLLPVVKRKYVPDFASVQASLPHAWGTGGVLTQQPLGPEELAAVFEDLASQPFLSMGIVPNPRQGKLWRVAQPEGCVSISRRAHVLDLEGGFNHVWQKRFAAKTRNKVRQAERSGLVVECDTSGRLIPVFYELFRRSVDRWAEQQHEPRWLARQRAEKRDPLSKLVHIARHLGEVCRVWVAWRGDRPAAAILVMVGHNADYMMGAMDKELAAPTNANDLLQKNAIEDACRAGCRFYHMGESGESAGIAAFKERFGARAYPYDEYRLERLPLNRIDRSLRGLVKRAIGFRDVGASDA